MVCDLFIFLVGKFIHTPSTLGNDKVLVKVSQVTSGVYLSNHLSESIHIWSIVTLES